MGWNILILAGFKCIIQVDFLPFAYLRLQQVRFSGTSQSVHDLSFLCGVDGFLVLIPKEVPLFLSAILHSSVVYHRTNVRGNAQTETNA